MDSIGNIKQNASQLVAQHVLVLLVFQLIQLQLAQLLLDRTLLLNRFLLALLHHSDHWLRHVFAVL